MPAPDGAGTLIEAVGRLAAANLDVADVALRRPSLDDVFLALTGDPARNNSTETCTRVATEVAG
jgi:ABC-2 type transport system ATP-binding protein